MEFPRACSSIFVVSLVMTSVVMTANVAQDGRPRVKRVIGGEEIEPGEWPYLVRLKAKVPARTLFGIPISYHHYYCGGSVIDRRWVVTAAHCVKQRSYSDAVMNPIYWHAKVGEIEAEDHFYDSLLHWMGRMTNLEALQTWNVHASRIVIHPAYNEADSWRNDIALFKLEQELPISSHSSIDRVALPPPLGTTWPLDGAGCIMKGWGCAERGGRVVSRARSVVLPKVSDVQCNRVYAVSSRTRLCAGRRRANTGICSGDSGGPLVCRYNDRWTLAGIASFTSANNPESFPGVFTRVTQYLDWIDDVIIDDLFREHYNVGDDQY